jgi:hypothetical protein
VFGGERDFDASNSLLGRNGRGIGRLYSGCRGRCHKLPIRRKTVTEADVAPFNSRHLRRCGGSSLRGSLRVRRHRCGSIRCRIRSGRRPARLHLRVKQRAAQGKNRSGEESSHGIVSYSAVSLSQSATPHNNSSQIRRRYLIKKAEAAATTPSSDEATPRCQ